MLRGPTDELLGVTFRCGRASISDAPDVSDDIAGLLELFLGEGPPRCDDSTAQRFLERLGRLAETARRTGQPASAEIFERSATDFRAVYESPLDVDGRVLKVLWDRLGPELNRWRRTAAGQGDEKPGAARRTISIETSKIDAILQQVTRLFTSVESLEEVEFQVARSADPRAAAGALGQISRQLRAQSSALREKAIALGAIAGTEATMVDGVLVRDAGQPYFVRSKYVVEIVRVTPEQLKTVQGRHVFTTKDGVYYVKTITTLLGLDASTHGGSELSESSSARGLVLVSSAHGSLGLMVDEVLSYRQTVVRPMADIVSGVDLIEGVGPSFEGKVTLVVNLDELVRRHLQPPEKTGPAK